MTEEKIQNLQSNLYVRWKMVIEKKFTPKCTNRNYCFRSLKLNFKVVLMTTNLPTRPRQNTQKKRWKLIASVILYYEIANSLKNWRVYTDDIVPQNLYSVRWPFNINFLPLRTMEQLEKTRTSSWKIGHPMLSNFLFVKNI